MAFCKYISLNRDCTITLFVLVTDEVEQTKVEKTEFVLFLYRLPKFFKSFFHENYLSIKVVAFLKLSSSKTYELSLYL